MRRRFLSLVVIAILSFGVGAAVGQEAVSLSAPVVYSSTTAYHLSTMLLDVDNSRIVVLLTAPAPAPNISKTYDASTTPTGATLLHNLNTANFTTNSFVKAVYNRLITDGVITGTIAGVPQD